MYCRIDTLNIDPNTKQEIHQKTDSKSFDTEAALIEYLEQINKTAPADIRYKGYILGKHWRAGQED